MKRCEKFCQKNWKKQLPSNHKLWLLRIRDKNNIQCSAYVSLNKVIQLFISFIE